MKYYFLISMDPDDNFLRNTQGNDLTLQDLKDIAQDRTGEPIRWTELFSSEIISGSCIIDNEEQIRWQIFWGNVL